MKNSKNKTKKEKQNKKRKTQHKMIKKIVKSILKKILFLPIIGFYFYNDINLITGISGAMLYILYTYVYKLSVNDRYFAMFITPVNFIESLSESHKLVSYGVSTIHALFISVNSTLYLTQIIDNYDIKQAFFISMSYYLADLYYIIDSSKKLTILDYFTICHHNIMIYFHIYVFNQTNPILEQFLLYYLNRGFIAEYSLLILNYSWYLVNTKQDNSKKMLISSQVLYDPPYFEWHNGCFNNWLFSNSDNISTKIDNESSYTTSPSVINWYNGDFYGGKFYNNCFYANCNTKITTSGAFRNGVFHEGYFYGVYLGGQWVNGYFHNQNYNWTKQIINPSFKKNYQIPNQISNQTANNSLYS